MWKYITDPGQAYNYVHGQYGWFGILFAIMGVMLVGMGIWLWLDRRR